MPRMRPAEFRPARRRGKNDYYGLILKRIVSHDPYLARRGSTFSMRRPARIPETAEIPFLHGDQRRTAARELLFIHGVAVRWR